jgi:cysteinyl-tRNA synthetase
LEADLKQLMQNNYDALADDFNTAIVVANLFDMLKKINTFATKPTELELVSKAVLEAFLENYRLFAVDILGLLPEIELSGNLLLESLIKIYIQAKAAKDYAQIDVLRADLKLAGVAIKDTKLGVSWAYIEQ